MNRLETFLNKLPQFISRIETFEASDRTDIALLRVLRHPTCISVTNKLRCWSRALINLHAAGETKIQVPCKGYQLTLVVCSSLPLLRVSRFKRLMLSGHRHPVFRDARSFELIYCHDEYIRTHGNKRIALLSMEGLRGKGNSNVSSSTKYLRGGAPKTRETCPWCYSGVYSCERASQSPSPL